MLKHWIWLTTRIGIGARSRTALLRMFGTAEHIYALTKQECLDTEGFQAKWLDPIMDKDLTQAEEILVKCDNLGISIMTCIDEAYPERLRNIADPPALLYYRGKFPDIDNEAVIAVVGTRKCSAYGLLHAKQFSKLIANSGAIVVTGGARGIDSMATQGALDSSMPVICVMGCGLDITYPRENKWLFREVEMHGCMISEYPPGTPPLNANFPPRNRIISGLSLGVLVIEAPKSSGALITANMALDEGRDVYTIPGNIGVKQCEGSNALLRDGASLVTDGWEIVQNYVHLFPDKLADARNKDALESIFAIRYGMALPVYSPILTGQDDKKSIDNQPKNAYIEKKEPTADLQEDEKTILAHLTDEPIHADQLVALSKLTAQRVSVALTMLQIKKLAEKRGANYFVRI